MRKGQAHYLIVWESTDPRYTGTSDLFVEVDLDKKKREWDAWDCIDPRVHAHVKKLIFVDVEET